MWCKHCGEELRGNIIKCPKCGKSINQTVTDTGNTGYSLLGFCFPLVGLILYLIWRQDQPNNAHAAVVGAIFALIFRFIFYFIFFVLGLFSI